jgi:antitoxin Phd
MIAPPTICSGVTVSPNVSQAIPRGDRRLGEDDKRDEADGDAADPTQAAARPPGDRLLGRRVLYDHSSQLWVPVMREIQLKDAKATLSAVVDGAVRGEEFAITRRGKKQAVVISWAAWERLSKIPSLGRLLAASPLEDGDLQERDPAPAPDAGL